MQGYLRKLVTTPGDRDTISELIGRTRPEMVGCVSCVLYKDSGDENALWMLQVWETPEALEAYKANPTVKATVAQGVPMIADMPLHIDVEQVWSL